MKYQRFEIESNLKSEIGAVRTGITGTIVSAGGGEAGELAGRKQKQNPFLSL